MRFSGRKGRGGEVLMATPVYLDREAEQFASFELDVPIRLPRAWLVVPRRLLPTGTTELQLDELAKRMGYAVEVKYTEYMLVAMVRRR